MVLYAGKAAEFGEEPCTRALMRGGHFNPLSGSHFAISDNVQGGLGDEL